MHVVLMDLKLSNIALKQNISSKDLNAFRKLNKLKVNALRKLSKLRNIKDSSQSSKEDLIYNSFLTYKSLNEDRYMQIIKNSHDSRNKIMDRVNIARLELNKLHGYFTSEENDDIRKELNKIETGVLSSKKLAPKWKDRIFKKIFGIIRTLENKNKYKHIDIFNKALSDIEYLFGDHLDYYKPILAEQCFNDNYQRYSCRGHKDWELKFNEYLDMAKPHITKLLEETTIDTRKIQLDIKVNTENILNPND